MSLKLWSFKTKTSFFKNYIYLVAEKESHKALLIDPVWDLALLQQHLKDCDLILDSILLTHSHPDHTHLADTLARHHQCKVYMHQAEVEFYNFNCFNLEPFASDAILSLGEQPVTTLHTPGHTLGSSCYLIGGNLFSGDTLFIEGCGLCWGRGADPVQMYKSIQKLKHILAPDIKIYPGHCYHAPPGQTFHYVREHNIYLDLDEQQSFVDYRMRKNQKNLFSFK